jgi:hypothetical protein
MFHTKITSLVVICSLTGTKYWYVNGEVHRNNDLLAVKLANREKNLVHI